MVYASKERVKLDTITYEDLADPKWRGKICIRSGQHVYNVALIASMIAAHGEAWTETWLKGVKANLARKPAGDDRLQVKGVYAGECDIAVGNTYYMGAMLKNDKEPEQKEWANSVNILFPNTDDRGTHVNISGAVVAKYAPHKDNAVKLLEFLASDKGQEMYADVNNEYPVKEDVPWSPLVKSWGPFKPDPISLNEIAALAQDRRASSSTRSASTRVRAHEGAATMSIHNKIRQADPRQTRAASATARRASGAEWLVGVGFRCWLAGYDTGDIACWETGWNEYSRVLGTERAKRAVTELACWVQGGARLGLAQDRILPVRLRRLLRRRMHGDLADRRLAASPLPGDARLRAGADRLELVEPVIDAANAFADVLQEADQRLSPEAVAALMADRRKVDGTAR